MKLLEVNGLSKWYRHHSLQSHVLRDLHFTVYKGSFVIIMGKSGSGKSTFLNVLGMLDSFDQGTYRFNGQDIAQLDEAALSRFRNDNMGFIFQQFHLIESLNIEQNVELPLLYAGGYSFKQSRAMVKQALEEVGLGDKGHSFPKQLSGGQQQRAAIARALVNSPEVIFADEPTGALDQETGKAVIDLLLELHRRGKTIVLVTHDSDLKQYATHFAYLKDGRFLPDTGTGR